MKRQLTRKQPAHKKQKRVNSLLWLFEPLQEEPRYVCQKFFSFDAAYINGKLYLALVDKEEPWSGLMVCTSHEQHESLIAELPQLKPHPVLGKWLYVSQTHPDFESLAQELVSFAARRDPRLGVETGKGKRSTTKKRTGAT